MAREYVQSSSIGASGNAAIHSFKQLPRRSVLVNMAFGPQARKFGGTGRDEHLFAAVVKIEWKVLTSQRAARLRRMAAIGKVKLHFTSSSTVVSLQIRRRPDR
jgi:hypothetical protein